MDEKDGTEKGTNGAPRERGRARRKSAASDKPLFGFTVWGEAGAVRSVRRSRGLGGVHPKEGTMVARRARKALKWMDLFDSMDDDT